MNSLKRTIVLLLEPRNTWRHIFKKREARHFSVSCHLFDVSWLEDFIISDQTENMDKTKRQKGGFDHTLKHLRYKERHGGQLPLPGTIDVQVIATGEMGTPKSVIISTEHLRYVTVSCLYRLPVL